MIGKNCTKCGSFKQLSDFYKDNRLKSGRRGRCLECMRVYNREYRKTHKVECTSYRKKWEKKPGVKDARRKYRIKHKYDLTPNEHEQMYIAQRGCCAICDIPTAYHKMRTDHDHKTGKVRGLLCAHCNTWVAAVDDEDFMKVAIEYVKRGKL